MQSVITKGKMVIDMEHKQDEAKLSPLNFTTANYVNDHLFDRVRHLKKNWANIGSANKCQIWQKSLCKAKHNWFGFLKITKSC